MANEITVGLSMNVSNGYFVDQFQPGTIQITQAAIGGHSPIVIVGTSEEDLGTGDISTLGLCALRNLDTTNYVTYGPKSAGSMVALGRIKAGEVAFFRFEPGITLRWIANTSSVKIQVKLLEA